MDSAKIAGIKAVQIRGTLTEEQLAELSAEMCRPGAVQVMPPPTPAEQIAMLANSLATLEGVYRNLAWAMATLAAIASTLREQLTPPDAIEAQPGDALLRYTTEAAPNGRLALPAPKD